MKQKRQSYYTVSLNKVVSGTSVERRVDSGWKPGRSRNKFKPRKTF